MWPLGMVGFNQRVNAFLLDQMITRERVCDSPEDRGRGNAGVVCSRITGDHVLEVRRAHRCEQALMPATGCSKPTNLGLLNSKPFRIDPQPVNGGVDIVIGLWMLGGGRHVGVNRHHNNAARSKRLININISQPIIVDPCISTTAGNEPSPLGPVELCEKGSLPYFQIIDVFNEYALLSSHWLESPLSDAGNNPAVR